MPIKGYKMSMEHKISLSKAKKGKPSPMKGRNRSDEFREKIKKANIKRYLSGEMQKRISNTLKGRFLGEKSPRWNGGKKGQKQEKIAGRKRPDQCEVCGSLGIICFDHDHITGKFRGWICNRCNFSLGLVKDNIETLRALANYIERSQNIKNQN
jgi:hypothetical protein